MKIVLCTIPLWMEDRRYEKIPSRLVPKTAIVSLMRWMSKFGYSADFYDIDMLIPSDDEIFDYFKSKQPDVVGLSAVVSGSYYHVKNISKIIRKACPSTWIILGGNLSASANVILRKTDVDICVEGEGENPWVSLLDYVKNHGTKKDLKELEKIKGLAFLNDENELAFTGYGDPIPKDEYQLPDYEILSRGLPLKSMAIDHYLVEAKKYPDRWVWFANDPRSNDAHRRQRATSIWTTKGCVGRCTFCQRSVKGYKTYNLEILDHHLLELKEKYDVGFIEIADESFGSDKKHALEVAKLMKKYDFLWFAAGVRCTSFTLEDLKFLKECGCTSLKYGVESGSKKILKIMEKRFKTSDVYTALKNAQECGFIIPLAICLGMPGETDQTVMETGHFIAKIAQMADIPPNKLLFNIFYALPFPGTPLYEYGQHQGVIGSSVDDEEEYLLYVSEKVAHKENYINLTGMSTKTVLFWDFLMRYEAMREFYKNPPKNIRYNKQKSNPLWKPWVEKISLKKKIIRFFWEPISKINGILVKSALVTHIPRPVLYIPMQYLLYAEYIMHFFTRPLLRKLLGGKGQQIKQDLDYKFKLKSCKPLIEVDSLRKINKKIRDSHPPPETSTEKNRLILNLGQ